MMMISLLTDSDDWSRCRSVVVHLYDLVVSSSEDPGLHV